MKAIIYEQEGETGTMEVVDGEFVWTYNGDEPSVRSDLVSASNYVIPGYTGDEEPEEGQTAPEQRIEAPAEAKFAFARRLLAQNGYVSVIQEV